MRFRIGSGGGSWGGDKIEGRVAHERERNGVEFVGRCVYVYVKKICLLPG